MINGACKLKKIIHFHKPGDSSHFNFRLQNLDLRIFSKKKFEMFPVQDISNFSNLLAVKNCYLMEFMYHQTRAKFGFEPGSFWRHDVA